MRVALNGFRIGLSAYRKHAVRDIGVGRAFMGEGRHRAVAGYEIGLAAQGPEPCHDSIEQILMIAHREISASDRSLKQDIANHCHVGGRVVENDVAGGVAGAVIDVQCKVADGHLFAIGQPAVGLENLAVDAVSPPVILKAADPEAVGFVRPFDGNAEFGRQRPRFAAMVDMTVGDQDFLDGDAVLGGGGLELGQVTAGINERAAHGGGAPEQSAILLEWRHRDDRGAQGGGVGHASDMPCGALADKGAGSGAKLTSAMPIAGRQCLFHEILS
jgi:hypothetical protein